MLALLPSTPAFADDQVRAGIALLVLLALALRETHAPAKPLYRAGMVGLRERGLHAGFNLLLGFFNNTLAAFCLAGSWAFAAAESARLPAGILHLADPPAWLHAAGALLILDLWSYAWHRMNHALPILWRFHRLHHSDRTMDVTTASRFHTVEILLSGVLRVPVIFLMGATLPELAVYETLLFASVQFHHANIGLPPKADSLMRLFLVTPHVHKIHHSVVRAEADSNYGSLLTVWDRLFRSFRTSPDDARIVFGAPDDRSSK